MLNKTIIGLAAAAIYLASIVCPAANAGVYLVKDRKPEAKIFLPARFGKATVLAAQELSGYVAKITGARLEISCGRPLHTDPAYVQLLCNPDGASNSFSIVEKGRSVVIKGDSDVAVLYGVYQYLNNLGVRWYMPGEIGENVPTLAEIEIGDYEKKYAPAFRSHGISLSGGDQLLGAANPDKYHYEYDLWEMRNKLQFSHNSHFLTDRHAFDFNFIREHGWHNIVGAALQGASLAAEPERFPLVAVDGKQQRCGGQICFTHPRNIATAVASAKSFFAANPDYYTYSLSLEDANSGFCECAKCMEANRGVVPAKDPNRVVWSFMNAVAKRLQTECPGKSICFLSPYGLMTCPPDDVKSEPNILCISCDVGDNGRPLNDPNSAVNVLYLGCCRRILDAGANMGAYDYTMFDGVPQPLAILAAPRVYRDLGYVVYTCESMGWDEQRRIVSWALAQLCWDANQDPETLLKSFCSGYYGAAGGDVLAVLHLIDDSARSQWQIVFGENGVAQAIMTDQVIAQCREILARARAKAKDRELERLNLFIRDIEKISRKASDYRKKFAEIGQGQVMPAASRNLAGANRDIVLKEMFSFAEPPKNTSDIFIFPETWKFKPDLIRVGEKEGWMNPGFDASTWVAISTWNFYEEQGFNGYEGEFWYRTTFKAPVFPADKRVFMRIGALDDEGIVYINGRKVFTRAHIMPDDWRSSFEFDVTDALKPGEINTVAVHGNDAAGMGGIHKPCGLYSK